MINNEVYVDKALDGPSPYVERIGTIHIVEEKNTADCRCPYRFSAKLIAVMGQNLLFERKNGVRILIDPSKIAMIVELDGGRGRS